MAPIRQTSPKRELVDKYGAATVEAIEASIELNLPIIVHSRNAEKETFDTLSIYKNEKPKMTLFLPIASIAWLEGFTETRKQKMDI